MISDTLSEAVEDIRGYLDEPIFADVYQGAVRQQIEELVAAMDATRVLLDTPPPVARRPNLRHLRRDRRADRAVPKLRRLQRVGGGAVTGHKLTLKPQPMADQWMGECSCGWRHTASLYQFDTREAAIDDIETAHLIHLDNWDPHSRPEA